MNFYNEIALCRGEFHTIEIGRLRLGQFGMHQSRTYGGRRRFRRSFRRNFGGGRLRQQRSAANRQEEKYSHQR